MRKYLQKSFKISLWIIETIIILFLLLLLAIQMPSVQNFAKEKAVTYLEGKIKTKVSIDSLKIRFPEKIILKGVYFQDQKKDTLLAGKRLAVDISLLQLINNKIEINSLELEDITANLNKDSKAVFNFEYIFKAFSSPEKQKSDSPPMQFSVAEIKLDRIKFNYNDAVTKNDLNAKLNHFETSIKTFDLDQMNFEIPKAKINGLRFKLKQGLVQISNKTKLAVAKNAPESILKLKLGEIDLSKIDFDYQNDETKLSTNFYLKKLLAKIDKIDLNNQLLLIESIYLTGVEGGLSFGKLDQTNTKSQSYGDSNNWEVKVNKTEFKRINFRYDNNNSLATKEGIDYNHLDFNKLNLQVDALNYNPEKISGDVNSLTFREKSGLNVQSFNTEFFYGKKNASLKKLYLKTPQTELKDEILIGYPSIESLAKNPGELGLMANLKKSKLGIKDILLFAPIVSKTNPFMSNPNAILLVNGKVSGKLKNLVFPAIEISGIGTTKVAASGRIIGLPDVNKAYFDLNIKDLQSGSKDFNGILPPGTIPNSIQLPSKFSAAGTFKGTIANFYTNLNLASNFGNAKIKGNYDRSIKNQDKYDALVELTNFEFGKFIKNDSIGKVTLKANIKGNGSNLKTATASFNGTLLKAYYNKYTYQNVSVKGTIHNGNFNATAYAKDPNLTFDLISSGSFRDKYPTGKLNLNVDIADLEKLNLHAGPMKIRGVVDADIQSANLDYLNGTINARNISIINTKEQFVIDSINVTATSTAEKNTLVLKSSFMDGEVNGKYKLSKIATALSNSIAKYYDSKPNTRKTAVEKQQFGFKIGVKDSPILLKLIPELKSLEPININGRYNSVNDSIVLNGTIPKLVYGENTITNAVFKVNTQDQALVYSIIVDDIQNKQIQLPNINISGKVQNNILDYTLQLKDIKDIERYLIVGTLQAKNGNNEVSLKPNNLLLNYESWKIAPDNLILFGKKGIYADNFELSKNGSSIKIQSQSEELNAPIVINFKDFDIKTITSMVEKKDLQMSGKINGNALVKNVATKSLFTSDLNIENFTFKKDTVGTISIKVNNAITNQYDAVISIIGQGNQVNLNGNYKTTDSSFDMNLAIERLNLKSIQGFTLDNIKESTGFFSGNFKITGNTRQPKVIGELQFNDIGFKAKQLNSKFKSANDKIIFTSDSILFDTFIFKDEKENDLTINGKINSENFSNFGFDLALDADNFKAINSKAKDNDLYYGELYLDNHLKISGNFDNPVVEGNIKINKDTKFTVVIPQSDPSIADREGIVEFIDQDNPQLMGNIALAEITSESHIKGFNASVNIEIDKEAEISLVIDKANGDYLKLKGEAQLNGGIDPSGKTTLTGRYELFEGSYEMNFNSIKRKFDIKKGSYILWTGEPTTANISIIAIYKTEAAPIDLVNDQLGTVTTEVRNTYKQKIPFETELKMTGELMKPTISFDIVLPEGNNSVSTEIINTTQAKLTHLRQQPDELNKQVFALLLLNRFIGENPFASEAGRTNVSSLARESASKILSQQLNDLAGDLINGVELNFDLNTSDDYTTGQRENKTDLNVGISKKLLNDRLKVTVGSSFGIEGPQQVNQNTNNIAGNVSLDYQLSKDGRYKIRAYRINKYQMALQGEVVETGIAFIITLDYNKFKELFGKSKTQEAAKKLKKESKKKSDE
ncbi:translocation/assembly module TamB domain-containing protein [Flavobacterium sp.]|uniref:translocation/assembly module TamB domain-containing protein n=1 Tax=Flavobacterium sp. TaxID=239 RepID=UPI001B610A0B|nr:translocation/assembly module TamB domain-containing protein [Flavobacterium sp.]MBP6180585.1 translocation/assembly module TamB [Flavobacterium sp.]